jgi:hypothetical protein
MKEIPIHLDKLGKEIQLNDCVAFPHRNSLVIGKIVKINPKMLRVEEVSNKRCTFDGNKYPWDVVIVDCADVIMYMLKQPAVPNLLGK